MRSYQHYSTGSHQNSEVKRAWARVVLGWVTSWEVLVLHSFFSISAVSIRRPSWIFSAHRAILVFETNGFLFFDFGRFDSQTVVDILRASSHSSIRNKRGRVARGEAVKHLRGAGARGPRVASARRGTGIRGRTGASMSDAIIPALKHRIPSDLRS